MRITQLDDIGDREAPPGSPAWARYFLGRIRLASQQLDSDVESLQGLFIKLEKYEAWRALGYLSMDTLCQKEIGLAPDVIKAIRSAPRHTTVRAVVAAAAELAKQGQNENSKKGKKLDHGSHTTLIGRGSSYLAARIKRDHPDIVVRSDAGEFPSMRAAAIAAGIIKVKTPLEQLQHWWKKASVKERERFLSELGAP